MKIVTLALITALGGCVSLGDKIAFKPNACPDAYIDYEAYHRRYKDNAYVPVQVQVAARSALQACAKNGVRVPYTVAEYNRQERAIDGREFARDLSKVINPKPLGEF